MEPENSGRPTGPLARVQTQAQAQLLTDPTTVRFLEPFLARERSASQAAAESGVAIDTMLYRIKRFLGAGLLEIVREEPRAGRPIKIYRTVADGFYVPFRLTGFAEQEEQVREQLRSREDAIARAGAQAMRQAGLEGRRIYRDAEGEVWHQAAGEGHRLVEWGDVVALREMPGPAFESFAAELRLTDAQSKELQIALYEAYERFVDASSTDEAASRGRRFVFRFQLAALDDEHA